MRVAIVNDSLLAVEILRRVVSANPNYEIAWLAYNGAEAVSKAADDTPDLILMDLIMPVLDGVSATRRIMQQSPCAIVIITASVKGNAAKVFEAMSAGALDALNTPVLGGVGEAEGQAELTRKLNLIARLISATGRSKSTPLDKITPLRSYKGTPLLAIGASTGGPGALNLLIGGLGADFPGAVVIAQHMDEHFIPSFVDWLNSLSKLPIRIAENECKPEPGTVLVAGSKDHLVMNASGLFVHSQEPLDYPYRPSVNAFFASIARYWTGKAIGVLLTGMGRDGADGLLAMRQRGFHTIAQDQATSAVFGMPKAAFDIGAACEVLALPDIAPHVRNQISMETKPKLANNGGVS